MDSEIEIKNRIERILETLGIKQSEMARRLGVKPNVIHSWITGRTAPSNAARLALCVTFGISREWLDTGTGAMFSAKKTALEDASFEQLQSAYIAALVERMPPEIQARVLDVIDEYIDAKKRREEERARREELEALQAKIDEERARARQEELEAEKEAERARRQYWADRYAKARAETWKSGREREIEPLSTSAVNAFDHVESVQIDQRGIGAQPASAPQEDAGTAALDDKIAELMKIRDRKRREAGLPPISPSES